MSAIDDRQHGLSAQAEMIGELATEFVSILQMAVRQLNDESDILSREPQSPETFARKKQVAADLFFLQFIIKATSSSLAKSWGKISTSNV